jgi:hypothetical protein
MRNVLGLCVLFLTACASRGAKVPVALPEVTIVQTGGVANAARNITGPIPVRYAVRVENRAKEPITLKNIQLLSLGDGAYKIGTVSRPFNVAIAPDTYEDVEIWANAVVEVSTITGANGPVTLRVILQFDSPLGPFQDVVVQQVNDNLTGEIR